ncbi:MAG: LptF/LptG family permease [Candidatus Wallbacteria bacterium]
MTKLKILDKYILREVISSFMFGAFTFLSIFLVDILMELIDYIISKGIPVETTVRLFLYALPAVLVLVIPMALLFSVLLALSRLQSDNEIIAMKAGGIHFYRIVVSLIFVGFFLTCVTIFLNEILVPNSNFLRRELYRKVILKRPLPKIAENVFFEGGKNRMFYVRKYDKTSDKMMNITVFEQTERNKYPNIIEASYGNWENYNWCFYDGVIREHNSIGEETHFGRYQKMIMPTDTSYDGDSGSYTTPREMSFVQLKQKINENKSIGIDVTNMLIELWSKTALPFASCVFVLIGAPLAIAPKRSSGGSIGMGISIIVIFIYYIIMSAGRALGEGKMLDPLLAAWMPNIIMGIIGALLIYIKRK